MIEKIPVVRYERLLAVIVKQGEIQGRYLKDGAELLVFQNHAAIFYLPYLDHPVSEFFHVIFQLLCLEVRILLEHLVFQPEKDEAKADYADKTGERELQRPGYRQTIS